MRAFVASVFCLLLALVPTGANALTSDPISGGETAAFIDTNTCSTCPIEFFGVNRVKVGPDAYHIAVGDDFLTKVMQELNRISSEPDFTVLGANRYFEDILEMQIPGVSIANGFSLTLGNQRFWVLTFGYENYAYATVVSEDYGSKEAMVNYLKKAFSSVTLPSTASGWTRTCNKDLDLLLSTGC